MKNPNYLELTPEDLEKVNKSRSKQESISIDDEQMFIAEFGKHYGWSGIQAILNNEIDRDTAIYLLLGARKVGRKQLYDTAHAVFIGVGSARSNKPGQTFKKATADIVKEMKADI